MTTLQDKENEWTFGRLIDTASKAVGFDLSPVKKLSSQTVIANNNKALSEKTYGEMTPTEQNAYDAKIRDEAFAQQDKYEGNMTYQGNVEKLDEYTPAIKMDSQSQFKPMTTAYEKEAKKSFPEIKIPEQTTLTTRSGGSVNVKYDPQISTIGMGNPSALQSAITSRNGQKLGLYKERSNKEFM